MLTDTEWAFVDGLIRREAGVNDWTKLNIGDYDVAVVWHGDGIRYTYHRLRQEAPGRN